MSIKPISHRRILRNVAIIFILSDLAVDATGFIWGVANIRDGDAWGAVVAGGLRGLIVAVSARAALRGRDWGRVVLIALGIMTALPGLPLAVYILATSENRCGIVGFFI